MGWFNVIEDGGGGSKWLGWEMIERVGGIKVVVFGMILEMKGGGERGSSNKSWKTVNQRKF